MPNSPFDTTLTVWYSEAGYSCTVKVDRQDGLPAHAALMFDNAITQYTLNQP